MASTPSASSRFQPEDVLDDEHLGVAMRPSADADGGNGERLRDALPERAGNALQHDSKGARLFQGFGVIDDLLGGLVAAALDAVAAELVDERRGEAEVSHD